MPTSVQYAASTVVSRADGEAAAFACSSAAAVAGSSAASATQKPKPSCTVTSSGSLVTRSCSRGPAPGGSMSPTIRRRLVGQRERLREHGRRGRGTGRRTGAAPAARATPRRPSRTMAGAAIGSSVHERDRAVGAPTVSGAVADGTSSRRATRSHSAARPANGRATYAPTPRPRRGRLLYRLPDPHGHGWRGPTSPSARGAAVRGAWLVVGTGLLGHAGQPTRPAPRFVSGLERSQRATADESVFSRHRRAGRGRTGAVGDHGPDPEASAQVAAALGC